MESVLSGTVELELLSNKKRVHFIFFLSKTRAPKFIHRMSLKLRAECADLRDRQEKWVGME